MDTIQIDDILLNILNYLNIDDIWSFFIVNHYINDKIYKFYQNKHIILYNMPLFRPCDNISTYLCHYKSYISGKNFPDEPLWLFNEINDPKYVKIDNKYTQIKNIDYIIGKSKFLTMKSENIIFQKGSYWGKFNNQQKYLIWCAIKNIHPEIKLDISLLSYDMKVFLAEIYYHYQYSFVRYYLEIYNIYNSNMEDWTPQNRKLINAKCTSKFEIERSLQFYREFHFYYGYQNASDKDLYYQNYFVSFMLFNEANGNIENNFKKSLIENQGKRLFYMNKFLNLNITSDIIEIIEKNINFLIKIVQNIDDLDIFKINNLKTTNINYLEHIIVNYSEHIIVNYPNDTNYK